MNKQGYAFVGLIMSYWWVILGILIIIMGYNYMQNYYNPMYCLSDTFENRATVEAYGFKIIDSQKSENQICFRSKDQALVQDMIESIEDARLKNELEIQKMKEENRNKIINTLLKPQYFYPLLIGAIILGVAYIKTKHRR